jgi:proprotein convertase subtilisin/kexin type 2
MKVTIYLLALFLCGCGGGNENYIHDPLEKEQWYLFSNISEAHSSINLPNNFPYKGRGITIAIVDNGIDVDHEDLSDNVGYGNYSYLPNDYNFSDADHGTSVAGIIAAVEGNGLGGRGVAPKSTIISFNAMRVPATKNIANALIRGIDKVDISNNSWGDFNGWGEPLHLKTEIENSLRIGTETGRAGKGIIYIFSAGNGALIDSNGIPFDNVNYSGLVNNGYTLPICAVDNTGQKTTYSETGATLLICAPSKAAVKDFGIVTADATGDFGYNNKDKETDYPNKNYTKFFGGTSAAAPMVTGVVALLLEANPNLSWRDVRKILAESARKNDAMNTDWVKNGAGLWVNHNYGFGLVDAKKAVDLALNWKNLPPKISIAVENDVNITIPDNDINGIVSTINVTDNMTVEFVDIYFDAPDHPKVGDLEIILTSPSGTNSILSELHNQTLGVFRYNNWRFGSIRHLGEKSKGDWKLIVKDKRKDNTGTLVKWKLVVHGY